MFTKTFTRERHIEELRAELRGSLNTEEAEAIREELEAMLSNAAASADRLLTDTVRGSEFVRGPIGHRLSEVRVAWSAR